MSVLALSRGAPRLAAFWVFLAFMALSLGPAFGETFDVPGERARTIGQALSLAERNADSSNIIEVATGTYSEPTLAISKSVTIRGKDGAKVVVAAATDPLVSIGGVSSVTLANLILFTSGTAVRIDGTGTVVLRNLVITRASTAIVCSTATTSASIDHVTFYQVIDGINCQTASFPIRNNIFSVVSGTPIFASTAIPATLPNYNLFHAATGPAGERGDNAFPNTTNTADDPEFVDIANNDFHLQAGSAAIERGVDLLNDPVDLGAYGGSLIDPVPFPPNAPSVTCGDPDPQSCTVSWEQNLDHLVAGYLVLTSAPSAPDPDYERTDPVETDEAQCSTASPPVCSFTRGSLTDTGTTPPKPLTPTAGFGDTKVQLTWPPVAGATTYDVYVGTSSPPATLALTVTPNSALVPDLTNGVLHHFAVRAVNQPKFFAAVQAVYGDSVSATSPASELATADDTTYGTAEPGPLSDEVTSTPQGLIDFPPLEDNGGCFIATASYGSPLAPQVDVLRTFRERYLRPYAPGRAAIRFYETWSPDFADVIRSSDTVRLVVRSLLWPIVGAAWIAVHGPWWMLLMAVGGAPVAVWIVLLRRRGAVRV